MSGRWLLKTVLLTAAVSAAPVVLRAQTPPAVAAQAADAVARDLREQEAILEDASGPQQLRDEAAKRLVSRQSPEARTILKRVLGDAVNRGGQLAVARALMGDNSKDREFVDLLANAIGPDRSMSDAAAQALAAYAYKGDPTAWDRLRLRAADQRLPLMTRAVMIRAMGRLVEKSVAQHLINILDNAANDPVLRNAAADALVEMTGIQKNEQDAGLWLKWWNQNRDKPEAQWISEQLSRKAATSLEERRKRAQLVVFLQARFQDSYLAASDEKKVQMLDDYLRSDLEDVRLIAVQQVEADRASSGMPSPQIVEQLRRMVGDSSTEVRQWVAKTLGNLNDAGAINALLAQLGQEEDTDVRASIARTLGQFRDMRAVAPLLNCLTDDSQRVAEEAAGALRNLAPVILKSEDANSVNRIRELLRRRLAVAGRSKLRDRLVEVLAQVADPSMLDDFYRLLDRDESPQVRRTALAAVAEIGGDPNIIMRWVSDPEAGVRIAAVSALRTTGNFPLVDPLVRLLDPAVEPDPVVRADAWTAIVALADQGSPKDLDRLAGRFARDRAVASPERRLAILEIAEKKLVAAKAEEELATTRQNIGQTLMQLVPPNPEVAAIRFRQALDYWKESGAAESVIDPLIPQLMDAMLQAHKYSEAMDFAAKSIRGSSTQVQTMGTSIRREVERLYDLKKYEQAIELLDASDRAVTPLLGAYAGHLRDWRDRINKDRTSGGLLPEGIEPPQFAARHRSWQRHG